MASASDVAAASSGEAAAAGAAGEDIEKLTQLPTEGEWLLALSDLVAAHGKDVLESWKDSTKHRHRLIHLAVARNYSKAVTNMVEVHGFDVNIARDSDQCTPMHLAMFYKKAATIDALRGLGPDLTLKNKYSESCDAKYAAYIESFHNIIFLDLELTHGHYEGLPGGTREGQVAEILEVAVVITNKDLEELGRGHWVIGGFSKDQLEAMSDFHQQHFRDAGPGGEFPPPEGGAGNGLFSDVLASKTTSEVAEAGVCKLLRQHCPEHGCPLAGNSVHCDREVLKARMPKVYAYISHRILDVSTIVGLMDRWAPEKKEEWRADQQACANYNHRVLNDVDATIHSLRWARGRLFA